MKQADVQEIERFVTGELRRMETLPSTCTCPHCAFGRLVVRVRDSGDVEQMRKLIDQLHNQLALTQAALDDATEAP